MKPWLRTAARDPLLHFLLLGALLFAAYGLAHRGGDASRRVDVSDADLARLATLSERQWGHAPSAAELAVQAEAWVREEVLVREAKALGLDQDDVVLRRRLAQKMEFLSQESLRAPSEAELHDHWRRHPDRYAQPAALAFEQLYFSPARRGAKAALADAERALQALRAGKPAPPGDPLMLPLRQLPAEHAMLARDYGDAFANLLAAQPPGTWTGPHESPLGWHLVRVTERTDAGAAPFEAVRQQVEIDLGNERVAAAREAAYLQLRARYDVRIAAWATHVAEAPRASVAQIATAEANP